MANVLILYRNLTYPIRATIGHHLYSFKRYSSHRCFYLNVALYGIPWYVKKTKWDLIIVHTILLSSRFDRELFITNAQKLRVLQRSDAIKVALPQDEFINMDLVCDFINQFGITHVFSVAPESEWPVIYRTVDLQKVRLHKILCGYVEDSLIDRINKLAQRMPVERPIDVGYRAYRAPFWWGRHGVLKHKIADVFKQSAPQKGLVVDISTRDEDTILGDDWFRFLLRCKYQLGVEGGTSIFDWDGVYTKKTQQYVAQHPQATFDEVEKACFPDADGKLKYFAITPRHFECCLTKTCQVLVEGNYDGVLAPGRHYIELKRDFSNLDEVLNIIARDELREEMTTRAWEDIVESGKYSYNSFVNYVIDTALADSMPRPQSSWSAIWQSGIYYWMLLADKLSWLIVAVAFTLWKQLLPAIPISVQRRVRRLILGVATK